MEYAIAYFGVGTLMISMYFCIGLIAATIWGINNIPKDGDSEDYIMATFPILVIIFFWIMFISLLPIWIINKLRR